MANACLYLFEELLPSMNELLLELESPHLRNIFSINKNEVQLTLTDHYIVLSDALNFRQPTHFCPLVFDTKFEVLYHSPVPLVLSRLRSHWEFHQPSNLNARPATNSSPSQPSPSSCNPGH